MKKLTGINTISLTNGVTTPASSTKLTGFPGGHIVRRLFIRLTGTITNGAAPVNYEPEIVSRIVAGVSLSKSTKAVTKSWSPFVKSVPGWMLDQISRLTHRTRHNKILDSGPALGARAVEHWLELPLSPNVQGEKHYRPLSEFLEDSTISVQLSINEFAAASVAAASIAIEFYAQTEQRSADWKFIPGGIYFENQDDFSGSKQEQISSHVPNLVVLRSRAGWTGISLRAGNVEYYSELPVEALDNYANEVTDQYLALEARSAAGDPFALAFPTLVGGAPTTENHAVAYNQRNQKDTLSPVTISVFSKSGVIPWFSVGWVLPAN